MNPNFKYTTGAGAEAEVKMTYGLLDALCVTCGDIDGALMVSVDNDLRTEVLNQIFADRDERGNIQTPANLFALDMSPEDVQRLLDWVQEHVADFFLKALEGAVATKNREGDRIKALQSISTGGET